MLRSDDFAPEVIELMARGPKVSASVIEAYVAHLHGDDLFDLPPSLIDQLYDLRERGLLMLIISAAAAFIAQSKVTIDAKLDINQAIEQIFGWEAKSSAKVDSGSADDSHVQRDASNADKDTKKKDGQRTAQKKSPKMQTPKRPL